MLLLCVVADFSQGFSWTIIYAYGSMFKLFNDENKCRLCLSAKMNLKACGGFSPKTLGQGFFRSVANNLCKWLQF
jgi:hypothetical protein